jgi:hypothetical protein
MRLVGTKTISYNFIEDDILEMSYHNEILLDKEATIENHGLYLQLVADKRKFRRLVNLGSKMEVTSDARKLCQQYDTEEADKIEAQAIVSPSYLTKILAYVYFKMYTPHYPIKLFTDRTSALAWLMALRK